MIRLRITAAVPSTACELDCCPCAMYTDSVNVIHGAASLNDATL